MDNSKCDDDKLSLITFTTNSDIEITFIRDQIA